MVVVVIFALFVCTVREERIAVWEQCGKKS